MLHLHLVDATTGEREDGALKCHALSTQRTGVAFVLFGCAIWDRLELTEADEQPIMMCDVFVCDDITLDLWSTLERSQIWDHRLLPQTIDRHGCSKSSTSAHALDFYGAARRFSSNVVVAQE